MLYTHYSLRIPNENISLKLSGNYKLTVYNDEGDEPVPVLTACFSLVEPGVGIGATVSTNTDIDFNKSHQQVDFSVNYGLVKVIDPHRELKTVVMQNRRWDNCVVNPKPNIQAANKIEFTHNRQLIFPAGNEYHKFEILDVHIPTLNVDRMEWFDPYYHATLYPNQTARNYLYDEEVACPGRPEGKALELCARFNYLSLNDAGIKGGTQKDLSFGLNYYINKHIAVKLNYSYFIPGSHIKEIESTNFSVVQGRFQFIF